MPENKPAPDHITSLAVPDKLWIEIRKMAADKRSTLKDLIIGVMDREVRIHKQKQSSQT